MSHRHGQNADYPLPVAAAEIIGWLDTERPQVTAISATLATSAPEVVAEVLQHWVRHSDAPEQLLSRGWADAWLWPVVESIWAAPNATPHADLCNESMLWVALSSLHGSYGGITFTQADRVKKLADNPSLHRGKVHEYRRRILTALVDAFHTPYVRHRTSQFGGWLYLLTDAAEEEFRAEELQTALELANEAWTFRNNMPSTVQSAKAIVHVASQIAQVAAFIRDDGSMQRLTDALDCLNEAEVALDHNLGEGRKGAFEYLTLALARENVLRQMSLWGIRPFLDCIEEGRDVLVAAFERFRGIAGLPSLQTIAAGDELTGHAHPSTHATIVRVLMRLAFCASHSGEWELSTQAISAAGRFLRGDNQGWDWAITVAFQPSDRAQREEHMERILRFAEGATGISPRKRGVLLERSAAVARDVSRAVYREKLFTTAQFWDRKSGEWTTRSQILRGADSSPATNMVASTGPGVAPSAAAEAIGVQSGGLVISLPENEKLVPVEERCDSAPSPMDVLVDRVRRGVPLPLILEMLQTGKQMNSPSETLDLSGVLDVVAVADAWTRPLRKALKKSTPADELDRGGVQLWLLYSASELAAVYAPHLLPEIHLTLSKSPYLDRPAKLQNARLCAKYARQVGRPNAVSAGLFIAVSIAIESGDDEVLSTQVAELIDAIGEGSIWSARGADLVETAYWAGQRTEKLITVLLREGYAQLATRLFDASMGRLHQSFRSQPAFATKLQLMERAWNTRSEEDVEELFRRMQSQILTGDVTSIDELRASAEHSPVPLAPDEVVVRLLAGSDRSWALMTVLDDLGIHHSAIELPIGRGRIVALSDLVWYELRPTRSGKPVTALRELHDMVIGPILERVPPGHTLLLYPQGVMSSLPLHAALGPEGYVIERYPVAYYPAGNTVQTATPSRQWLVCGWDVSAHAEREAREVARVLRQHGHHVDLPANAVDGRTRLLLSTEPFELVHVMVSRPLGHARSSRALPSRHASRSPPASG